MTAPAPTLHVLLIGIDYYKPNRLYKSLQGAVRDINLVETFLKETFKIPVERIRKLISPNPDDPALAHLQSSPAQEPTYANLVKAFADITQTAQPGDQVYIHYSGHGGRATTIYPNLKQGTTDQMDEGLVPMDIGDTAEGRYLRDIEMNTLLKRMTEKGLIVTVVLDSCHSGGSTRGDADIRSSTEPDRLERSPESLVASRAELEHNWLELTATPTDERVAGLPQTRDYVLLAACRPNEYAYEYAVNGGQERHGALTYWMIDTLTSVATSGQPLTYKLLHDRVNAQIQSKFPQQLPMLVGDSDRLVFGSDTWSTPFTVTVIKVVSATQVTLNAGQAQGLSRGTRFSIYPYKTTDFTQKERQVAIVELTRVDASESSARVVPPAEGGIATNGTLEPGAPAIMVAAPVDLIQRVRFTEHKVAGEQDHELPAHFVDRQKDALDKVRQALAGNGWVVEEQDGESAFYQVAIDREGNYEICKNIPIPNLRPPLSIDDPTAPQRVVDRLVHLTKYQAVASLDNSSSKLAKTLMVEVLREDGQPFADTSTIAIASGDIIGLRLSNQGPQPLKVAVLDLEPTWEISQIPIGGLQTMFFALEPGATENILLQMTIPDDAAYGRSQETIKVFAVQKGLADFRWLTLPPLDEPPETRGAMLTNDLQGVAAEVATRGAEPEGINPLNDLLAMIGADLDQAPITSKAASVVVDPTQEWVTKQVQIVVER
ncbi:MAG: caspase family protein [Leptolyngbyaceae cyanobacterium bins.349]|nr:caspase family protein [Leptolyngbyaceae cyanobacterium bins.349]